MATPTRPLLTTPADKLAAAVKAAATPLTEAPTPEEAHEVASGPDVDAAALEAFNAGRRARFIVTTGDAPVFNGPTTAKLNAKTLAEHAAGKAALAQYAPASE